MARGYRELRLLEVGLFLLLDLGKAGPVLVDLGSCRDRWLDLW
jgi:hypothetical protein